MNVHFVCRGNTFRSRIAEAYLNSKKIKDLKASSSGIEAAENLNGDITPYTKKLLSELKIIQYTNKTWTQTTKDILQNADLIVFMSNNHLDWLKNTLRYTPHNYLVFDISDMQKGMENDNSKTYKFAKTTYNKISSKIDQLVAKFTK